VTKAPALFLLLAAGCNPGAGREPPAEPLAVQVAAADAGCGADSVRPVTVAPAAGLWGYENPATSHRVAAMVGPVVGEAGAARVTRTVETIESGPGADTIRHGSDTASLHLEFIPPFARPAAVYSLGPLVRLAAYEPCGGRQQPLIRYLRQDTAGRVTTDVLLQREARP
jgi:hypothetical protein